MLAAAASGPRHHDAAHVERARRRGSEKRSPPRTRAWSGRRTGRPRRSPRSRHQMARRSARKSTIAGGGAGIGVTDDAVGPRVAGERTSSSLVVACAPPTAVAEPDRLERRIAISFERAPMIPRSSGSAARRGAASPRRRRQGCLQDIVAGGAQALDRTPPRSARSFARATCTGGRERRDAARRPRRRRPRCRRRRARVRTRGFAAPQPGPGRSTGARVDERRIAHQHRARRAHRERLADGSVMPGAPSTGRSRRRRSRRQAGARPRGHTRHCR